MREFFFLFILEMKRNIANARSHNVITSDAIKWLIERKYRLVLVFRHASSIFHFCIFCAIHLFFLRHELSNYRLIVHYFVCECVWVCVCDEYCECWNIKFSEPNRSALHKKLNGIKKKEKKIEWEVKKKRAIVTAFKIYRVCSFVWLNEFRVNHMILSWVWNRALFFSLAHTLHSIVEFYFVLIVLILRFRSKDRKKILER